ncbi:16S rRNA (adenine(1518)-N(6)/adenine(1519)-N(6))-dimethyltransferase RsmA [Agrilactobacillus fermenti]|uniref:16S rRNA (adenine(1518)-N(6)/adenine(1519)-N(6))- dimethyltransferase RsmA n=1 Tax=Agrilactobacillus fermenti TaxID=2586909 RepID=UPI003A5C670B
MSHDAPLISSMSETKAILQKHGFTFKKSLGQNFLTNPQLLMQMVSAADLTTKEQVLEIGPGIGALTQLLAHSADKVVALEIDQRLLPILADTLAAYHNVKVMNQDVLKTDLAELVRANFDHVEPIKVVANLPYYITTPILFKLLAAPVPFAKIVVMMQKEVAQRLVAEPGHKDYGSLSVAIQTKMTAKIEFKVPKTAFVPQPKVDSAIVSLTPLDTPLIPESQQASFNQFVLVAFKQRRKQMINNFLNYFGKSDQLRADLSRYFEGIGIKPTVRAEALSLVQLKQLYQILLKNNYNFN